MTADLVIFDDPVREPPSRAEIDRVLASIDIRLPALTRRGSHRNRAGELVTWGTSEDES